MKPTSQRKMIPGIMNFSLELQNVPAQKKSFFFLLLEELKDTVLIAN